MNANRKVARKRRITEIIDCAILEFQTNGELKMRAYLETEIGSHHISYELANKIAVSIAREYGENKNYEGA